PISRARVPIVKFYSDQFALNADINFGHRLGVCNSLLLRSYTFLDPRLKVVIMLVKIFAKLRKINDSSHNTISSYAYALMVVAFFQQRGIVGNLQAEKEGTRELVEVPMITRLGERSNERRSIDVTFASVASPVRVLDSSDWQPGPEGIPQLFFDFLDHLQKYNPATAISVKDGGIIPIADPNKQELVVLDPFEEDRNCCRMVNFSGFKKVKIECARVQWQLAKGEVPSSFPLK
ncbi:hypothetical protein HDU91_004988, partial [Kappamyces sp. JEL0680]